MARRGVLMLMELSELRELAETYSDKIPKEAMDQIRSLLDKCVDFNVITQKWTKPCKANIVEAVDDHLKQTMEDKIMKGYETWLPWPGLVEELRVEFKIAYDKFINVQKKYFELIEKSRGNQRNELVKAFIGYIARDIQDYIKYAINIILFYVEKDYVPMILIGRIAIHFEVLARTLEGLNVRNEDVVRRLAEDVSLYKQCMFDYGNYLVNGMGKFDSKSYLMLLQKGGIPFSDLIKRKMNKLKFEGEFYNLEYPQQIEVYQGIINEVVGKDASEIHFVHFIFDLGGIIDEIGEKHASAERFVSYLELHIKYKRERFDRVNRLYCKRKGDNDKKDYCVTVRNDKLYLALPSNNDPAQLWRKEQSNDSKFMLVNDHSNKSVNIPGLKCQLVLVEKPINPDITKLWTEIKDINSGYKYIKPMTQNYLGMVMDVKLGKTRDGVEIIMFPIDKDKAENQLWRFVPAWELYCSKEVIVATQT